MRAIQIDERGGDYNDILLAVAWVTKQERRTTANAAAKMIRQSSLYKRAMAEMAKAEGGRDG